MDIELLEKLTQTDGASGNEEGIRTVIEEYAKKYCDDVYTDALGNLIANKKGTGSKIMLSAHMDEIGVIATHADENGFIRFSNIGGLYTSELVGRRVRFKNGTVGVIGAEEEFSKKPKLSKLFIDIGADTKKSAMELVNTGDTAVFTGELHLQGRRVISKAIDNRVGCYILLKAMEDIKTDNDIYFVFSTQEEVGLRGAKTSAYSIDPDYAIVVDVTDTGDFPTAPKMEVKLGGGAAIKVMDYSVLCDAYIRTTMVECAKKNSIPYQLEIMTDGGTDAGAIHLTRSGVKTGGISVPTRYIHSPSEMADTEDINACIKLLKAVLNKL